jgi:hypothetical protein
MTRNTKREGTDLPALTDQELDELQPTELPDRPAFSLLVTHVATPSAVVEAATSHVAATHAASTQASETVPEVPAETDDQ